MKNIQTISCAKRHFLTTFIYHWMKICYITNKNYRPIDAVQFTYCSWRPWIWLISRKALSFKEALYFKEAPCLREALYFRKTLYFREAQFFREALYILEKHNFSGKHCITEKHYVSGKPSVSEKHCDGWRMRFCSLSLVLLGILLGKYFKKFIKNA